MKSASLAAVGLATLVAAAPALAGLFDDEEARKKIAVQQQQLQTLEAQNKTLEGRLATLEETAKKDTGTLELLGQIEALTQEVRQLRGRIEEQGYSIEAAAKRQKDFYVDLDSRVRRLEKAAAAAPSASPPAAGAPALPGATSESSPAVAPAPGTTSSPAAPAAPSASSTPESGSENSPRAAAEPQLPPTPQRVEPGTAPNVESKSYEAAYQLFKAGNYQAAIDSFGNFLKTYPKSPLASSAQYWIGNSYYAQRDYRGAISSQQKLLSAYPESQKAPDAWLNIASSQLELGDAVAAKKTLEELVAKYPVSEAAEKAKKRLASIK